MCSQVSPVGAIAESRRRVTTPPNAPLLRPRPPRLTPEELYNLCFERPH